MIAFTTLFLGLVVGVHPVEIVVGDEVASVEFLLDGRSLATLREPPWNLGCDFGAELAPQWLEVVARDADGMETGRVRQMVNMPYPRARMSVLVDEDPEFGSLARLSWESTAGESPRAISAFFDGKPIAVEDPRRIPLPAHDDGQFHLFTAELEFAENVISQVMVTFGGLFTEQVHSELTAIPVMVRGRRNDLPSVGQMRGWFVKNGEILDVISVEQGRSDVILVQGTTLTDLGDRLLPKRKSKGRQSRGSSSGRDGVSLARTAVPLPHHQTLRFLTPVAREAPRARTLFNLYPLSPEFRKENGGLYWLLTRLTFRGDEQGSVRVADAVAVAGLAAYERQRRRAVVLVAGSEMEDTSSITASQSRRYLQRLKVPFFVWTKKRANASVGGWGSAVSIGTLSNLESAFKEVNEVLERQWIVWLDGRHLPQDIKLGPEARGIDLLGDS